MSERNGTWPASPEDEVNLRSSREIFQTLAALLHTVAEANHVEPLGGFDLTS